VIAAVFAQVGALLVAATSKKQPTSSSAGFLIIILVIGVGAYFFFLRPQQQKARRQRQQSQEIAVGDEILTVGGIVGRVVALDAERVTILSGVVAGSDGDQGAGVDPTGSEPTRLVLVRNAIARKVEPRVEDVVDVAADGGGQWGGEGDAAGGAAAEGVAGRVETHEPPEEGSGS
jgi:preprotein translocase YajC subunit